MAYIKYKYIIIDALDKYADREDFITFISNLVNLYIESLYIMITSRREKDIKDQLGSRTDYKINIQSTIIDEDIRVYIYNRLAIDNKLKKWPEDTQHMIITALMKKADGI